MQNCKLPINLFRPFLEIMIWLSPVAVVSKNSEVLEHFNPMRVPLASSSLDSLLYLSVLHKMSSLVTLLLLPYLILECLLLAVLSKGLSAGAEGGIILIWLAENVA